MPPAEPNYGRMMTTEPQPAEPKPKLGRYQYSLRSLMILMLLSCIAMSWVGIELRKAREQRELPQWMGGGQSSLPDREYRNIDCLVWRDGNHCLYYAICMGYVDFDPNLPLPPFQCQLTSGEDVGEVVINGKRIDSSHRGRLLALNPFGRMVEISLSPHEEKLVASDDVDQIWKDVVLKRLYRREGRVENGRPVGHWTYGDSSGRKGYEGRYLQGKRDGKCTYYHENGRVRAEFVYKRGKLHGQCKYYSGEGRLTDSISWKDDYPIDRTVRQTGLAHSEVRNPGRTSVDGTVE